jgi:hypothetical protein
MTMELGRMLKPLYDDPVSRDSGNSKGGRRRLINAARPMIPRVTVAGAWPA